MTEGDFAYWWSVSGEWVEPPNERRNGWSGMMRVVVADSLFYVKRQRNHLCRTLRHPFGWPTASREWTYLKRLHALGLNAPNPVFHGVRKTPEGVESVLVTEELNGFKDLSEQGALSETLRVILATELGDKLGLLHRARLQHSSLYDKHIMVRWLTDVPEIALIDLEKMRARFSRGAASRHDLEQLKRRQKVLGETEWQALMRAHTRRMAAD